MDMTEVVENIKSAEGRPQNISKLELVVGGSGANREATKWLQTPAHELSTMIKDGRLSCVKLCQLFIERIKLVQPKINGMAQNRFEAALREASELDELLRRFKEEETTTTTSDDAKLTRDEHETLRSPLFGIPVSVKESIAIKGMRNSAGDWKRRNTMAEEDAVVVKNVKRFGMIPVCTSNVPELTLFWADCHNSVYGRSRNPYDQSRITGASSGGEGALLAAGASVCGIGSDIGGSLRNPAHYCGIMSHKPSPFLVSSEGNHPFPRQSRLRLFTLGPMCRYASDLRHLLRLLLSDKDNQLQDSYKPHQPEDVTERRKQILKQLENPGELADQMGRVKLLYCRFKPMGVARAIIGQRETRVQRELMDAQQEVLNHFASKFGCTLEEIDLDKYLDKMYTIWQAMIVCGGTEDRDEAFVPNEVAQIYGIDNLLPELLKYCLGMSKHTKECFLSILFGLPIPNDRQRAYKVCEQLEKLASEIKAELEQAMGQMGCVIMPTLPTTAHKHHYSLLKTNEVRFPCLWNVCQMPATHVTIRLDKKRGLPYGLTIASRAYNDALTISLAEEIERTFGGWTPPPKLLKN